MRSPGPQANPRLIALSALARVEAGEHVQAALAANLETAILPAGEKQFCADLVYGILREKIRINYIIRKILPRAQKLPPRFLAMLSLGVYGLLAQTHVPPYATVNETVGLIKRKFGSSLAGVANGALRSIQRMDEEISNPEWYAAGKDEKGKWRGLCIYYGMPQDIGDLWKKAYGFQNALALLKRSSSRPWAGVRVNAQHPLAAKIMHELERLDKSEKLGTWGIALPPGKMPEKIFDKNIDYWRQNGALDYQAPGSLLVMEKLGLGEWSAPVWDCCAGSGGKTAWLAEKGVPVVLASDTSLKRLAGAGASYARPWREAPAIVAADAAKPPFRTWRGHILADAPCSGLGVLARRPDIRHKGSMDFAGLMKTQKNILAGASAAMLPGNELAYITCTLNPSENGEMIKSFLTAAPAMELLGEWSTPHAHPWLEGMYGALMRRKKGIIADP